MDTTEKITPRVQDFDELKDLKDNHILMIVLPNGKKRQTTLKEFKEYIKLDIMKEIEEIKEKLDNFKLDSNAIIKAFSRFNSINFGKPLNIKSSKGIEKGGKNGDIYATNNAVRVKLGNAWKTIKTE